MAIVTEENFENVDGFGEPEITDLSSSTITAESVDEKETQPHMEEQMTALGMKEV